MSKHDDAETKLEGVHWMMMVERLKMMGEDEVEEGNANIKQPMQSQISNFSWSARVEAKANSVSQY